MPRSSPFRIVLSRDESRELTRRANKYTLPYYQVVRAKMILLAAEGWSNDEIATSLHTRREIVSLVQALLRRTPARAGRSGASRPPTPGRRCGRPSQGSGRELPATLAAGLSRFSVADVALQARQFGLVASISGSTVWRWLNADAIRPGTASLLDLSARSAVHAQGWTHPRPVCAALAGAATARRRVRAVHR